MDAGNWISVASALVAVSSAGIALTSLKIARASRDQAVAANHRADTPRINLTCDGKFGNSLGLVVVIESDKDLNSLEIELTDTFVDGKRGGFNGLWVDKIVNMPMNVTYGPDRLVTFQDVRAGSRCVVVAQNHGKGVPKEAELRFRLTCVSGERPPWVIADSTGPLPIHYSSA